MVFMLSRLDCAFWCQKESAVNSLEPSSLDRHTGGTGCASAPPKHAQRAVQETVGLASQLFMGAAPLLLGL